MVDISSWALTGRDAGRGGRMPIPCRLASSPPGRLLALSPLPSRLLSPLVVLAVMLVLACNARAVDMHPALSHINRAEAAVRTDPQASANDARIALNMLTLQPNPDLQIRAHLLLCDHLSERDRAGAEEHVAIARWLLPQARRKGLEAGILACEGTILETAGDIARAEQLYDQAVAVATSRNDAEQLAGALFARGHVLGLRGEYAAGLSDLKQAQALYSQLNMPDHAMTSLNGVATLYNRIGDYQQARDIYASTLVQQRAAGMLREQVVNLHNLGRAHENLGDWAAARQAFQEAYDLSRELSFQRGEAYALRGLAAVQNATGSPETALTTLEQAAVMQRQTPDVRLEAMIELTRGMALRQMRSLPQAVTALNHALKLFRQSDTLIELRTVYSELAAVHAAMGEWQRAYGYLQQASETAERLFRNQLDQRFATLKVEFDTAAKEQENLLLQRENEASQTALAEGRRARSLQAAVIALTVLVAVLLGVLAWLRGRATRRMQILALTDELTGVPNRRAVLARLAPMLQPGGTPCAMFIIDIDHFKGINDQHGHAEGDEALKLVADGLRAQVHEPAFIGRLGGEEFVVVAPHLDVQQAYELAEHFRQSVMDIDSRRWLTQRSITVSIGLTLSPAEGDTPSTMLQRADAALYDAKRAGRNCVKIQLPPAEAGSATLTGATVTYA